jgi:hypothetical protein
LQQVKARFGEKAKRVEAVQSLATDALWLDRVSDTKGLVKVSNAKLIRLHAALTRAKEEFGSRAKLVAAILGASGRAKDAGYRQRLESYPLPRLLDVHDSQARRAASKQATKPEAAAPKKRRARSKKAKLKAAA